MRSMLWGLLIGFVVGCVGVALFSVFMFQERIRPIRAFWAPAPLLVLTRDVAPGQVLTDEDLTEVMIPSQFITDSFVKPAERPAVVGRTVTLALAREDALSWSAFARQDQQEQVRVCVADGRTAWQEVGERARDEALQAFARSADAPLESPPLAEPAFVFDARSEDVPVVVVTRELNEGDVIPESALEIRPMPRALITPSIVPAAALKSVGGSLAVVAMLPGEALRWQYLDAPSAPRATAVCVSRVSGASTEASTAAAKSRAEAFFKRAEEGR